MLLFHPMQILLDNEIHAIILCESLYSYFLDSTKHYKPCKLHVTTLNKYV